MGIGRWICGFLGFINGGPLGALAGYAIGWLFEKGAEGFSDNADNTFDNGTYRNSNAYGGNTYIGYSAQQQYEGQRNSFLFSLLVLASYIMKADGRVMHSEMELVRTFLRRNFGEIAVREGEEILLRLFERQKQMGEATFKNTIRESCAEIAQHMRALRRAPIQRPLQLADGTLHRAGFVIHLPHSYERARPCLFRPERNHGEVLLCVSCGAIVAQTGAASF